MDVKHERGTIFRAPHRKLPYIDLGGTLVPDSEICYNSCIEKGLVRCLDKKAGLSEKEIAISRSLRALVEKNLSEMLVYERWVENWYNTRDQYLADIPSLIRPPLAYIFAYRTVRYLFFTRLAHLFTDLFSLQVSAAMWSAGISRYSPTQRQNILEENVSAFSTLVPKSGYIMGKSIPTRVDATAFGFLASLSHSPECVAICTRSSC